MPHYDFKKDIVVALKTEIEVVQRLMAKFPKLRFVCMNDTSAYDILFKSGGLDLTVEVKEDFTCERTGNVGVEFECRGKPSGISISKADKYFYKIHEPSGVISYWWIHTDTLKNIIKDKQYDRIVSGGDVGSNSKNYLFKLDVIKAHFWEV